MKYRTKAICSFVINSFFIILGIVLIVAGILLPGIINSKISAQVAKQLVVNGPDSPSYARWLNNTSGDSPITTMSFYYFNITNPVNYSLGLEKPNLQEVGPYVYQEVKIRFDVSFPDEGAESVAKTWQYFIYRPDLTPEGLDPDNDQITTVNLALQGAKGALLHAPPVLGGFGDYWYTELAVDLLCSAAGVDLLLTSTPTKLSFGYNDTLLSFLQAHVGKPVSPVFPGINPNETSQEQSDMESTYDTMNTGQNDITQIMQFIKWQNMSVLPNTTWGSVEANTIKGTDGSQFAPNVDKSQDIDAFISQAQRTGTLEYEEDVSLYGVLMYRFVIKPSELENASENPANDVYYSFGPSGLLNITGISKYAPMFLSQPHFLGGDAGLVQNVTGLNPNKTLHQLLLDVEPISGTTMNAAKRLQINVLVTPQPLLYPNINETYVPVVWVQESGSISQDIGNKFTSQVYGAQKIGSYSRWIGIPVGAFIVVLCIILIIVTARWKSRHQDDDHEYQAVQTVDIN